MLPAATVTSDPSAGTIKVALLCRPLMPRVLSHCTHMGEQTRDVADSLGPALSEHHAHVRFEVLWVLNETEPNCSLITSSQVLFCHVQNCCSLTYRTNMDYWMKDWGTRSRDNQLSV